MTTKIIRAGVLLIKNNKILVLNSKYSSGEFYLLPGGGIVDMETVEEAAIRETKEETNYDIKIKKLLYVKEWINKKRGKNIMDMIFLGEIMNGKETHLKDPCSYKGHICRIEWKSIDELKKVTLFPKDILKRIEEDIQNKFKRDAIYLASDVSE